MTKRKLLLGSMLLVGLLQVVTYLWGRRLRSQYLAQEVEPGTFKVVAVTEGKDEKIASQLKGGIIRVLMGGLELDLRDAKLERKPVVVETTVAFGGVDMKVPRDWTISVELTPSLGGVANGRPAAGDAHPPDLLLRGRLIFGGINID